jgi:predicted Zn-dependent protease with MMP-like domain
MSADELIATAWRAYRNADAMAAVAAARAAVAEAPKSGAAWYALGCCLERAGALSQADRCFRFAARTSDDPQPPPYRVSWRRFEQLAERTRENLPAKLRSAFAEVTLILADYAEPSLLIEAEEPELLGLFVGHERGDRMEVDEPDPSPCIYIFRRAHEHSCSTRDDFAAQVRMTIHHEFGHYLGYDEEGLEQMGLG